MLQIDLTKPGGLALFQDTLARMQTGYTEAFQALLKFALTGDEHSYALTGIEHTPNGDGTWSYTEGWASWNGIPVYVPAGTYTAPDPPTVWLGYLYLDVALADTDPLNDVPYQNNSLPRPYRRYVGSIAANVGSSTPPTGNRRYWRGPLLDRLRSRIDGLEPWRQVGQTGQPAWGSGWVNGGSTQPVAFRKDGQGRVWLRGAAIRSSGNSQVVFTLPEEYRPTRDMILSATVFGAGTSSYTQCYVQIPGTDTFPGNAGEVTVNFGSGNGGVYLDGLVFWAE